jgi:hypothetical protein
MPGCGLSAHLSVITGPTPRPRTAFIVAQQPQEAVQPIARDQGQQAQLHGASTGTLETQHCARPELRRRGPSHDLD